MCEDYLVPSLLLGRVVLALMLAFWFLASLGGDLCRLVGVKNPVPRCSCICLTQPLGFLMVGKTMLSKAGVVGAG